MLFRFDFFRRSIQNSLHKCISEFPHSIHYKIVPNHRRILELEFYNLVITDSKLEDHLNPLNCTTSKYRAALTWLRIGAHCFDIERGRYGIHNAKNSIPREHRLCRYCNEVCQIEKIESEEHLRQNCHLYYKSRMEFQTTYRNVINASNRGTTEAIRDDDDQNTNDEIIFFLSKFCHKIFINIARYSLIIWTTTLTNHNCSP